MFTITIIEVVNDKGNRIIYFGKLFNEYICLSMLRNNLHLMREIFL